jgi:hypothetical protein
MRLAPAAAVTVAGLLVACGGGTPTAHASPSPSTTTPATTGAAPTSSPSTHAAAATTAPSAPAPAPATAQPIPTTAPTAPAAVSPAAHAAVPTPAPGPCAVGDVALSTTTDKDRYATGQNVQVTVEVRNQSAHSCIFGAAGDFTIDVEPSGPSVFAVHLDCPPDGCAPLAPGQMSTYPITWNQVTNEGPGAPRSADPGSYHARAAFPGYPVSTSASFSIGPSPT